jgi:hypothetical protein
MGKQYNKLVKRQRREKQIKRKRATIKAKKAAK